MYDPNGIQVELTCRVAKHDAILAEEAARFGDQLERWSARTRHAKLAKFGEEALSRRGRTSDAA
jgi:hypothetical protein